MISQFSSRSQSQIDEVSLSALRIGIFSLYQTRSPEHSCVDQAVELCNFFHQTKSKGFVNGILRNILREKPKFSEDINDNLPPFLMDKLFTSHDIGWDEWKQKLQSESPMCIVYKGDSEDSINKSPMIHSDDVYKVLEKGTPRKWEGFHDGNWWIQDISALKAVDMVLQNYKNIFGSIKDISILDMCAAPGGKTFRALQKGAKVFACDMSQGRIDTMYQNFERLKFTKNQVFTKKINWISEDLHENDFDKFVQRTNLYENNALKNQTFDLIILDAPCTASGLIRRHPDIRWNQNEQNLNKNLYIQNIILTRSQQYLKNGGLLLYAVCSVYVEEGQKMVRSFYIKFRYT